MTHPDPVLAAQLEATYRLFEQQGTPRSVVNAQSVTYFLTQGECPEEIVRKARATTKES